MLGRTSGYGAFKKFVINMLLPMYSDIGYNSKVSDKSMTRLLRKDTVKTLCVHGYPDCEVRVMKQFESWRNSKCK